MLCAAIGSRCYPRIVVPMSPAQRTEFFDLNSGYQ